MKSEAKRLEVRSDWKLALLGTLVGQLVKVLSCTMRVELKDASNVLGRLRSDPSPMIFCLWHNQILPAFVGMRKVRRPNKMAVMASASRDGAGLASLAESFGHSAVRGSSSRRGRAALMALIRELRAGRDAGITPDGPRGPRYTLQSGVLKLAQATGTPIILVRCECRPAWRLRTWDRFRVPLPFGKLILTLEAPLDVPRTLAEDRLEALRLDLEERMQAGLDDIPGKAHDDH